MFSNIFHIENDMYHYHNERYEFNQRKQELAIEWCLDVSIMSLRKGMDVCVSNTFTKVGYIDSYVNYARALGCNVKIYRMMGNFNNIHNVPENILENMRNNFEDYIGEKFVYPNLNYNKDDPSSTEYIISDKKLIC